VLFLNGKISDVEIPKAVPEQEKALSKQKAKMPLPRKNKSFRDTVCMTYPDREQILVIFELDGDTDLSQVDHSAKVKFSKCGKIMKRFTTVPEEKFDAIALIGGVGIVDDKKPEKDEDIANLQAYLDNMKDDVDVDKIGTNHWELREEIHLPFEVEQNLLDKYRKQVTDFFIDTNGKGCTWGYFWLIGLRAKKKLTGGQSGRLVGRAARDS
jgi:hypothetical protein